MENVWVVLHRGIGHRPFSKVALLSEERARQYIAETWPDYVESETRTTPDIAEFDAPEDPAKFDPKWIELVPIELKR